MQLRVVLIGAALLIAIFADQLALRIGHTENQGLVPTKGHQVGDEECPPSTQDGLCCLCIT